MSAPDEHGSDSGTMDMKEHLKTWHGFLTLVKWIVIGNIGLLTFLAIFRTHD
jgi:Bacterial aa3 type cytochrome c oxidase subunit IV